MLRSRKAGNEDQIVDLFIGQCRIGGNKPLGDCLGQHLLAVNSAPVITNTDYDLPGAMLCGKMQSAFGRFADSQPLFGFFDPVIDCVAHQVRQWLAQPLDHGFVELSRFARNLQLHLLAGGHCQFAQQAR